MNSDLAKELIKGILLKYFKPLIFVIFLMILGAVLQSGSILGLMPIVDYVSNESPENQTEITRRLISFYNQIFLPINVFTLGAFFLVLILAKNGVLLIEGFIRNKTIMDIMKNVIYQEYVSFLNASWSFFGTKKYGILANTVAKETEKATVGFESLAILVASGVTLTFYTILLLLISWKLSIFVILVAGGFLYPLMIIFNKIVYRVRKKHTEASNTFQGNIYDTLNSLKLILGFSKREDTLNSVKPHVDTIAKTSVQFIMVRLYLTLISEPLIILIVIISVFLGLTFLDLAIAELIAFIYATNRFGFEIQTLIASRNGFIASLPSFEQIAALKNEAESFKERSDGIKIKRLDKGIFAKDIFFSYDGKKNILEEISLDIPQNQMIAIVGASGAGKSSLIDLIMGFDYPQKGSLVIDKIPIQKIDLKNWRSLIGYIPQQPFLFNTSIENNLFWANKTASKEEVDEACKLANAYDFIMELDKKYETVVGEKGVKLSGGQAQRICLARALIKKPQILILDEATSSLDSKSEKLIQESIENLAGERTIICIAHRLATIRKAKLIYYLDSGRIIEKGSFEELIKMKGKFFQAAELQGILA